MCIQLWAILDFLELKSVFGPILTIVLSIVGHFSGCRHGKNVAHLCKLILFLHLNWLINGSSTLRDPFLGWRWMYTCYQTVGLVYQKSFVYLWLKNIFFQTVNRHLKYIQHIQCKKLKIKLYNKQGMFYLSNFYFFVFTKITLHKTLHTCIIIGIVQPTNYILLNIFLTLRPSKM